MASAKAKIRHVFGDTFSCRAAPPDILVKLSGYTIVIHRSKKDGDMSILPECIAGIKKEYVGKDDKKQSYWIEILTQV